MIETRLTIDTPEAMEALGAAIARRLAAGDLVLLNGELGAGKIAMDQFVVDVGDNPVKVGDRAVLFGDPATGVPSATDWAEAASTINYEIVTRIGGRVARRYV